MSLYNLSLILVAFVLVVLNGFFVAAEFALVKVRGSRVDQMVRERRPFARSAKYLADRLEAALSSCQLGITMASLGLGWVGEPAAEHLLRGPFEYLGLPENLIYTLSFVIAFTFITGVHLVIGEQAPKIFAIRQPERMLIWCALPMRGFFLFSYPLMYALNKTTSVLLSMIGMKEDDSHDAPLTEEELRMVITEAHLRGNVSRSEHSLIHAVFEFDDMVCRNIMVARADVEFFDINESVNACIEKARRTKHTRYPLCDGTLDDVVGVIHIKDLVGVDVNESFDWKSIMRPPKKVPEHMQISKLLRHFQATHQLLAFVIDEYGTTIGIVTLENVLETIIGEVDDEFDEKQSDIVPSGPGEYDVSGGTLLDVVASELKLDLHSSETETFSGYLTELAERILSTGDRIVLNGATAEVVESRDDRVVRVRVTLDSAPQMNGVPNESS